MEVLGREGLRALDVKEIAAVTGAGDGQWTYEQNQLGTWVWEYTAQADGFFYDYQNGQYIEVNAGGNLYHLGGWQGWMDYFIYDHLYY